LYIEADKDARGNVNARFQQQPRKFFARQDPFTGFNGLPASTQMGTKLEGL
jgi:hypothetical protein